MKTSLRGDRNLDACRSVVAELGFQRLAEGSVLYRAEGTVVLVTASIEEGVPRFLEGTGEGWLTAEYQMHPRCNPKRREPRDGRNRPQSGRAKEIERLIGRSLRAALDLKQLGEKTITIDCDVLEADGGTRTASITAGWLALAAAIDRLTTRGLFAKPPLRDQVAAVSAGLVDGCSALDLCYAEDSRAQVDMNAVATANGGLVEVQSTAEGRAITRTQFDSLLEFSLKGIQHLCSVQREVLTAAGISLPRIMSRV
jgi:ribonuclease PH